MIIIIIIIILIIRQIFWFKLLPAPKPAVGQQWRGGRLGC